jgi:hypothetical protein
MPLEYTVYAEHRLILGSLQGNITFQDFVTGYEKLRADNHYNPDYDVFTFVLPDANALFDSKQFHQLSSLELVNRQAKRIYYTYQDYHFGFLRMYEGYRKTEDEHNFCVYRDLSKALQWLNETRSDGDVVTLDVMMHLMEQHGIPLPLTPP